jgi:NTE family protein
LTAPCAACAHLAQPAAEQIYKADSLSVLRSGARWLTLLSLGWALARWSRMRPRSLLDNQPLGRLLNSGLVPLERMPQLIDGGHLHALAITASSYSSGEHVTFFQAQASSSLGARPAQGRAAQLTHAPAGLVGHSLHLSGHAAAHGRHHRIFRRRLHAPDRAAGARHPPGRQRMLVVGAGRRTSRRPAAARSRKLPTLAQVAGHALSSIFLDTLAVDVERAERINQTLA